MQEAEEIIASHQGWLIHVARRYRSNWCAVQDLAQEGAMEMWRAAGRWDGRGNLAGWMKHAARLKILSCAFPGDDRKTAWDLAEYAVDPHSTSWDLTQSHDNYNLVEFHTPEILDALDSLSEREREYVILRFWEEADTERIKSELGKGGHAYWKRAKLKLREKLAHLEGLV
jgi:RNA polymerase sigma factor (sigma-70 family)